MNLTEKNDYLQRIDAALDAIRPHLAADGGNIEVVDLTDDMIVQIKWMGNCEGCSMSSMTMRAGIEETLKDKIPQVKGVTALNGVGV
ncbi:MAG: Fe-S cluster biogenesis protein NfuA [Maribacter sp.]|jgi:Fe-S cluster biogenesis protein NfuA